MTDCKVGEDSPDLSGMMVFKVELKSTKRMLP